MHQGVSYPDSNVWFVQEKELYRIAFLPKC